MQRSPRRRSFAARKSVQASIVDKHPQKFGIVRAIPGARAALRWCGWAGIGVLVVPAVILAVLLLRERFAWFNWMGVALIVCGAYLAALPSK